MLFCKACEVFIPDEDAVKVAFGGVATTDEYLCPHCSEELENVPEEA